MAMVVPSGTFVWRDGHDAPVLASLRGEDARGGEKRTEPGGDTFSLDVHHPRIRTGARKGHRQAGTSRLTHQPAISSVTIALTLPVALPRHVLRLAPDDRQHSNGAR